MDLMQSIDWAARASGGILPPSGNGPLQPIEERPMIGIGTQFPRFSLTGVVGNNGDQDFRTIDNQTHAGKWLVVFFWPKDFTFVCPTEIAGFGKVEREFADRDAQILGVSIDSEFVHQAWRKSHDDLRDLPFPMLADIKRELSTALGILDPQAGVAHARPSSSTRRASFASST
jgi:peroxiredoxin (alkyl hydroperoxide reductase subunit C)